MNKKITILLVVLVVSVSNIYAQQQFPKIFPNPNSTGYSKYGYSQADSGFLFTKRDTFVAKFPTLILHNDNKFYYSLGNGGSWQLVSSNGSSTEELCPPGWGDFGNNGDVITDQQDLMNILNTFQKKIVGKEDIDDENPINYFYNGGLTFQNLDSTVRDVMQVDYSNGSNFTTYNNRNNLMLQMNRISNFDASGIYGGIWRFNAATTGTHPSTPGSGFMIMTNFNDTNYANAGDNRMQVAFLKQTNKIYIRSYDGGSGTYGTWHNALDSVEAYSLFLMSTGVPILDGSLNIKSKAATPASPLSGLTLYVDGSNNFNYIKTDGLKFKLDLSTMVANTTVDVTQITTQGNTFNGINQLVKLNSSGYFPTIDGRNLTNLDIQNLSLGSGTARQVVSVNNAGTGVSWRSLALADISDDGDMALQTKTAVDIRGGVVYGLTRLAAPVATSGTNNNDIWINNSTNNLSFRIGSTDYKALTAENNLSGLTSTSTARTNLGITTWASNLVATTNPSAIRYIRINADNTVSLLDAATFLSAIGGSGGGGSGDMLAATYDPANIAQQVLGTTATQTVTNKNLTSGTNTFPTLNQNTTGSAAKWTTARNLAGNSVDGSANIAFTNAFIVQGTSDAGLTGAQFLGALGTGIVKNTTTTGVLSIATAGTDYLTPTGSGTGLSGVALLGSNNTFTGTNTFNNDIGGTKWSIFNSTGRIVLDNSSISSDGSGALTAISFIGALTGNASTATTWATGRTVSITGDLAYTSGSLNGSGNVTGTGTLATVNSDVGTYTNSTVTVNAKGLITAISSGSTPEVPLTFSSGLTRSSNTITNDLITGKAGGQTIVGDINAGGNLILTSTSNATKGFIYLGAATTTAYDGTNGRFGIGTGTPSSFLHVVGTTEQVRFGYDAGDYMTISVASTGAVTFDNVGSTNTFTFSRSLITSSGIQTNSAGTGASFAIPSGTGANTTTNSNIIFGGAATVSYRGNMRGSTTASLSANHSFANMVMGVVNATGAATGTHAVGTNLAIKAPTFTSGGATLTDFSSLYIDAAPTGGTNNWAMHIAAGNIKIFGKIVYDATLTASGTTGNQTINKPSGTVNIAAAGTSVVVTNSLITTSSLVRAWVMTNDANKSYVYAVVPASGSATIYVTAPAAEIKVGFVVEN